VKLLADIAIVQLSAYNTVIRFYSQATRLTCNKFRASRLSIPSAKARNTLCRPEPVTGQEQWRTIPARHARLLHLARITVPY
jgi:hypothetical protein